MVFHTFLKSTLHTHFKQALYTSTLSKHFIKALYTSTLSKHFIKALYTSTLSKHFIRVFLKHFRNTRQGIAKVLREGITKVLREGITQVLWQGIKTRHYNKVLRQDSTQQSIKHLCTNLSVCFPCRLFFASLTVVDCIRWKGQGLHLSMEDVLIKCIAD